MYAPIFYRTLMGRALLLRNVFLFLRNAHKVRPYARNNDFVCGYNHLEDKISVTLYIDGVAVNVQGLKRTTADFFAFFVAE